MLRLFSLGMLHLKDPQDGVPHALIGVAALAEHLVEDPATGSLADHVRGGGVHGGDEPGGVELGDQRVPQALVHGAPALLPDGGFEVRDERVEARPGSGLLVSGRGRRRG